MKDSTNGWVTFQKIPLHDGRVLVVQKNDGQTRSRLLPCPTTTVVDPLSATGRAVGN